MKAAEWAAWVQAVFSVVAIVAGFATTYIQSQKAAQLRQMDKDDRERDRVTRAEAVAFRLSGWLGEVSGRIEMARQISRLLRVRTRQTSLTPRKQPHEFAKELKLNVIFGIDDVMADLHYLTVEVGDVAQLDYLCKFFDAYLDFEINKSIELSKVGHGMTEVELADFFDYIDKKLENMHELHANAARHIKPIIEAVIKRERVKEPPATSPP